jgi:hypothetical protein
MFLFVHTQIYRFRDTRYTSGFSTYLKYRMCSISMEVMLLSFMYQQSIMEKGNSLRSFSPLYTYNLYDLYY